MAGVHGVSEADLSSEAQGQLRQQLSQLDSSSADFTQKAVGAVVTSLKSAYPGISREHLSAAVQRVLDTQSVVGQLPQKAQAALRSSAPHAEQLTARTATGEHAGARQAMMQRVASTAKASASRLTAFAEDPRVQSIALPGGASAAALGAAGGALGVAGGAMAGGAAGLLAAPFTFGLSIPVGAFMGGGAGGALGTAAGMLAGLIGGGAVGRVAYTYRDQLKGGADNVKGTVADTLCSTQQAVKHTLIQAKCTAMGVAGDNRVQATAATVTTAAGGALAGAASAGVAGLVMGGVAGGALGLIPAPLTFGLSIPVGAFLGACGGGLLGAAAGGTAGLLGGGATGYGFYRSRHTIGSGVSGAWTKVQEVAKPVTERASAMVSGTGGA